MEYTEVSLATRVRVHNVNRSVCHRSFRVISHLARRESSIASHPLHVRKVIWLLSAATSQHERDDPLRISKWKPLGLCNSRPIPVAFLLQGPIQIPPGPRLVVGPTAVNHASVKQKLPGLILFLRRGLRIPGKTVQLLPRPRRRNATAILVL
jgi:hypothetical protein